MHLKREMEVREKEYSVQWKDLKLEVLSVKDENRELKAKVAEMWPLVEELKRRMLPESAPP